MKVTVILLWVAGIVLLMAVAFCRGRKRGVSNKQSLPSDRELLDRATSELQALRAEVHQLGRQIEELPEMTSMSSASAGLKPHTLGSKL
ncbi:hypothetical protein [Pseudomonas sp. MWU13-2105]|uniref:hypothetical protein n=1 Tax=Pseudomonas sp. MWU13-2105 TaxID=2935074 RepID=UPI00200DFA4F|nr:hypothetical protein [Pseudomonas sp. MWU13-2105]